MDAMHDDVIKWKHFSAFLSICAGNSPVTGEFPAQRPVTRSFDGFFFNLSMNKRLSKQWWCWWLESPSRLLWRHCNTSAQHCDQLHGSATGMSMGLRAIPLQCGDAIVMSFSSKISTTDTKVARLAKTWCVIILSYHNSSIIKHLVKCIFCSVWVQNFVWNFKGQLEPVHLEVCISLTLIFVCDLQYILIFNSYNHTYCLSLAWRIWFNPLRAGSFRRNIHLYLKLIPYLCNDWAKTVEILPHVRKGTTSFTFSQYQCCWWPGNASSGGISSHDIVLVKPVPTR